MARVNACNLTGTPKLAVQSWAWFRDYYLAPDEASSFDPGFFKPPYLPSPPGHYSFIRWLHQFGCVGVEAPRGWAKSTLKRAVILWKLLTVPRWEVNSFLAKDDFVLMEGFRLKQQLEDNPRILDDFGEMKPTRGKGIWTNHAQTLVNGAIWQGVSIDGKMRGLRGDALIDDVERDDDQPARSWEKTAEFIEKMLRVIVPMQDVGGHIALLCTFLGKQSFAYHVIQTDEDERFKDVRSGGDWFKIVIPAIDAKGNNAWAAKYTPEFLDMKRRTMGEAFFQTEYMGNPQSEDRVAFAIRGDAHEYTVDVAAHNFEEPLASRATLQWHDTDGTTSTPQSAVFGEHVGQLQRVLTVDPASSLRVSADFSAVVVGGICPRNNLWLLDGWHGRCYPTQLAQEVWKLALKWRVSLIAVESFGTYVEVYRIIRDWQVAHTDADWHPSVIEYRPPATYSKEDRIMSMQWRFDQGRIKLPAYLRMSHPTIIGLYHQLTNFTPDGRGLSHDDIVDATSAVHFVLRTSGARPAPPPRPTTIEDRIAAGEVYYPGTQIPLLTAIDFRLLTPEALSGIIEAGRARYEHHALADDPLSTPEPGITVQIGQ